MAIEKEIKTSFLLVNEEMFNDKEEHEYNAVCRDGYAICTPSDNNGQPLLMVYPSIDIVRSHKDMVKEIRDYRGHYITAETVRFDDIAIKYGKLVDNHVSPQSKVSEIVIFGL